MRQSNYKKRDKVGPALILCFCLIALTSLFTVKANIDKLNQNAQVPVSEQVKTEEPEPEDVKEEEDDDVPEETDKPEESDTAEETHFVASPSVVDSISRQTPVYIYPISSEDAFVTNPFSMDALIYSATLDQYMTHSGTDIQAPAGSEVLSIGDGIVTAVYTDDRYGHTIEVTHDDGLLVLYSNLGDSRAVEMGDEVAAGDVLGSVGSSGLFESLDPPHLHLEVLKDGSYVNPEDYINNLL